MNEKKEIEELKAKINQMQHVIQIYERLAEAVRLANVMDGSVYSTNTLDDDWLSIDRDDYAKMVEIISEMDLWKPWQKNIQQRISHS